MEKNQKKFKSSPKRFHPPGISILYEDQDIIVVDKISGLLTISTERIKEHTVYFLLNEYVKKGNYKSKKRIFIVHRLDKDTSGLIVFAKNQNSKKFLQENWHKFKKKYYGIISGKLKAKEGTISTYLAENKIHKMYSVDNPKMGKLSKTGYKVLKESKKNSLLEIELFTGRKNQIRVHFFEKGCPIIGDKIYGLKNDKKKKLALHATMLSIIHPFTKQEMTFKSEIPKYFEIIK